MRTEKEKMLEGVLYNASDLELVQLRSQARKLFVQYNNTSYDNIIERNGLLKKLFGSVGENADIQAPFYCDYGVNIYAGNNLFINFNCTILDCNRVTFGNFVFLGPNVQIYTAHHPLLASERIKGPELATPVTIEDNVWIGGGVIICQGVTIGKNSTIGAGSVVTRSIPSNVFAAGNPCRVIKNI